MLAIYRTLSQNWIICFRVITGELASKPQIFYQAKRATALEFIESRSGRIELGQLASLKIGEQQIPLRGVSRVSGSGVMKSEFAVCRYLLPKGQPVTKILNVRIEIIADSLKVRVGATSLDSLLVPVRYLDTDKHTNDDDKQFDRNMRKISGLKALKDLVNDQWNFPFMMTVLGLYQSF